MICVFYRTIINDNENQSMFKEEDEDIQNKFEKIQTEWETKRMQYEKLKKVKENFNDINYYGDSVMY